MRTVNTTKNVLKTITKEIPYLSEAYPISKLAIFGSYAKEQQHIDSDIDILIDYEQPIGLRLVDLKEYLELILNIKVDLVTFQSLDAQFYNFIKNDLIYVYERY